MMHIRHYVMMSHGSTNLVLDVKKELHITVVNLHQGYEQPRWDDIISTGIGLQY